MSIEAVLKAVESVESKIKTMDAKASGELETLGKVSADTKAALDGLGVQQRELADRIMRLEQKGSARADDGASVLPEGYGQQFVKAAGLSDVQRQIVGGRRFGSFGVDLKNTVTNAIGNTYSQRQPGIVPGASRTLQIEGLLTTVPASANAIDYLVENVFTNAATEVAEGALKPESSLTLTPKTMPVSTVAHWIKITKQLAADNAALAAYINARMIYGVNLRAENQLVAGNGTAPNISGLASAGNFTAHGYTAASLAAAGLANNRFDLIGKMIGDAAASEHPADAILLNPFDWWTMRLAKGTDGRYLLGDPGSVVAPSLFGLPLVATNAIGADTVMVGAFGLGATLHNREGVVVEMSDSDGDNFQRNLITIRAERRLALTVEVPAAFRFGDLTPA